MKWDMEKVWRGEKMKDGKEKKLIGTETDGKFMKRKVMWWKMNRNNMSLKEIKHERDKIKSKEDMEV